MKVDSQNAVGFSLRTTDKPLQVGEIFETVSFDKFVLEWKVVEVNSWVKLSEKEYLTHGRAVRIK